MRTLKVALSASFAIVAMGTGFTGSSGGQEGHNCLLTEARKLADLGGVFMADDGSRVHVRIASASIERREQVRAALSAACNDTAVVVEPARHTLAQLREWAAAATDLLALDGVSFVGPDERADALTVGITTDDAAAQARRLLVAKGVPPDSVRIERTSPIRTAQGGSPAPWAQDKGGSELPWAVVAASAASAAALAGLLFRGRRRPRSKS